MIAQKTDVSTEKPVSAAQKSADRLLAAYNRLHPNYRVLARRDFCEHFGCSDDSFRAKRSGKAGYPATEQEIQWMEDYKPQIVKA